MTTINAQTIINEVMDAYAVAPSEHNEHQNNYACYWPKFAPWGFEDLNESTSEYPTSAENAYRDLIYDLMTDATSEINDLFMVPTKIKFQTSERGFHTVRNIKANLKNFADLVRKNAAAFGGGLVREAKQRPTVSWPANLISLFKQSIEDHDYQATLDIGDKLGALFFVDNKGAAQMQVAPVPCDFESRLSSVCNEDGTYAVIFPQNMTVLSGSSVRAKRSRAAQIENVQTALENRTNFNLSEALDKQSYSPVDQVATRAQWILEHGLDAEVIETRIVAHESESIEQQAAQDVAQVVAQAVAAVAIGEAMQPSEAGELVTCEAGESEASAPTASQTSWAPTPQYVPPSLSQIKPGAPVPPAYRGGMDDTDPPSDGNAKPTTRPVESTEEPTPPVAVTEYRYALVNRPFCVGTAPKEGFLRIDARPSQDEPHHAMSRHGIAVYSRQLSDKETKDFELAPIADGAMLSELCAVVYADMVEYADGYIGMASKRWTDFQSRVMHTLNRLTASYRVSIPSDCDFADMVLKALAKTWATNTTPEPETTPHIPHVAPSTPPPAEFLGDATPPVAEFLPDLEYTDSGMFTSFAPNTPAGVTAWNELARLNQGTGKVLNQHAESTIAQLKNAGYTVAKASKCKIDDDALLAGIEAPIPPVAALTPPVAISTDYASDIPISLAVSAYNGVSMSPERRGQSAKSEYAATMAADYEKLRAQAVKGGTLDLLHEVFARYRARQSSAYKAYLASSSRCVSSFIVGPANFPAARMNKRADIAHKRLNEYLDGGQMALQSAIRQLRPDLRAIMAGDADAIDRLTVKIEAAERAQASMKAANKAIRANAKQGEAHQVAALMELGFSERQASSVIKPDYAGRIGFASYELTNNNANIRRMRERLEQISKAQATEVQAVECANGVTLEDDAPANRVRLYFPGKPSEAIRSELKSNGFRWAPSVGAWQAYRNYGTLATARRMAGEPIEAEESTVDAVEVEEVAPPPAVESQPVAPVVVSKPNSEGERIRAAADKMRDQFPAIAAKYDDLATSHDLKDEREAQQVQNVPETPQGQQVIGKSGKWSAYLYTWHDGKPWMTFEATSGAYECNGYATASERMKALQALARAADAPTDTPPGGGLPCTDPVAAPEPVASVAPTPTVAVSSASPTPRVAVRRNFIPDNGQHIVDDAFEAWTFPWEDRFSFVMYLGKSAKPWKMFSYSTEAKRDDGFNRYATDARAIALSKADRKAQSKAQADKPHGLQVGDVVRSSWGYEQTNVNHYQIIKVIGKRTVEVRALAEHEEVTGAMTGRLAPVHGEFMGEVMRRQVDSLGQVNIRRAAYGRASKIEPLAIVHGVRCYAASGYSSHA